MAEVETLEIPEIAGIGPSGLRQADQVELPDDFKDMVVISADNHIDVTDDIFFERLPDHLKERGPRVWFDRWWRFGAIGPQGDYPGLLEKFMTLHSSSGIYDFEQRVADLKAEGSQKEIVFPQLIAGYFSNPDLALKEAMFRVYNEYMAEKQDASQETVFPVGLCSNWWDAGKAIGAVQQIADLGLKALQLPLSPGKYPGTEQSISWGDEKQEVLFAHAAALDLPICFHVGESVDVSCRGSMATSVLTSFACFRKQFAQLVFGGVFDRNPTLKVVFAEGGISWVPGVLQDAELIYDTFGELIEPRPKQRPSHYWHENCHATFQNDRAGLEQLKYIGADNVMWAADYPHAEGSFGFANASLRAVIDAVSADDARKIISGNARRVFKI